MYSNTVVVGYIGRDASVQIHNGKTAINFTLAHTARYTNSEGVVTEKTSWYDCSMWEKEKIAPYLKKGTLILAEGEVEAVPYVSKDGEAKASLRFKILNLTLLGSSKETEIKQNKESK